MRTLVKLMLIAALLAAAPRAAAATVVPDPSHNSVPAYIVVVGTQGEVIDLSVFLTKMGTGYSSEGCSTTYCP